MSSGQTICGISLWVTWLMLIAGTRMACEAHEFSDPLRDNKHVRCWHIVLCVFRAWSGFYVSSLYLDTEPKALSRGAMLQPFISALQPAKPYRSRGTRPYGIHIIRIDLFNH